MSERPKIKGSVSKRGEKWLAQLPPSQGRRGRTFDNEADAWTWLVQEGSKVNLGIATQSASAGTVSVLMASWLQRREQLGTLKETTLRGQRRAAEVHILSSPLGALPIEDVRGMHIDTCLTESPMNHTRNAVAKVLKGFFDWAENNRLTVGNPYRQSSAKDLIKALLRQMQPREGTNAAWTPEHVARLIQRERDPILRDYWIFTACTGARRGEAVGLRWSNVNIDEGRAQLVDNVTVHGTEVVYSDSPKNWKPRTVYFGKRVGEMLLARREEQDSHRAGFSTWESDYVFDRRRTWGRNYAPGIHLNPAGVTLRFARRVYNLKLPTMNGPHGLRRTFATIAEREGFPESVREAALGHTPDLAGLYTKASEAELRELAEAISNLILPDGS